MPCPASMQPSCNWVCSKLTTHCCSLYVCMYVCMIGSVHFWQFRLDLHTCAPLHYLSGTTSHDKDIYMFPIIYNSGQGRAGVDVYTVFFVSSGPHCLYEVH
jgi:hypothetical protein